jgi:hypothetical protein|tara:strand:- start:12419 stop:12547 length:129 start_codon:yes stop_codon:yes gene_type:complete
MTIISDTAKIIINKNRDAGESMDEYFLGKDPRKTKYYGQLDS